MQFKLHLFKVILAISIYAGYCTTATIVQTQNENFYNVTFFGTTTKCQTQMPNNPLKFLTVNCLQKLKVNNKNFNYQWHKNQNTKNSVKKAGQNELEEKDDNISNQNDETAYFTAVKRRTKRRAKGRATEGKSSGRSNFKKSGGISTRGASSRLTRAGKKRTNAKPKKGMQKRKQQQKQAAKRGTNLEMTDPMLDSRGEGSFKSRKRNYDDKMRKEKVQKNRERTEADGLKAGPSRLPQQNFVLASSMAKARDMATRPGRPSVFDTAHGPRQKSHYHMTKRNGEREGKNSGHYGFSGNKQPPEYWKLVKNQNKNGNKNGNKNENFVAGDDFNF